MGYGVKTTPGNATSMNLINIIQEILLEAGWTKTADTGQWDGVSTLVDTDEYVIWSMPTDGGTLDPVLLKIQPANTASPGAPHINLTIGKESDGSGTLTGTTWTCRNATSAYVSLPAQTVFYAYDNGGVVICSNHAPGYAQGYTQHFILIERKRTTTGAPVNGALGTMVFLSRGGTYEAPATASALYTTDDLLGVSVFNTNTFAKTWGTQSVSSPIADATMYPKSTDGLTTPTQPVMFFGPDGGWYSNLILVVQPSEGGTAMQAVVNGSPRYYRTVQPTGVSLLSPGSSYPITGSSLDTSSYQIPRFNIVPAILNQ